MAGNEVACYKWDAATMGDMCSDYGQTTGARYGLYFCPPVEAQQTSCTKNGAPTHGDLSIRLSHGAEWHTEWEGGTQVWADPPTPGNSGSVSHVVAGNIQGISLRGTFGGWVDLH